jgi:hypothetical protein
MDDRTPRRDEGEAGRTGEPAFDRRRAIAGGLTLLGAVLGFTVVQAAIQTGTLSDELVLVALPAFGVVGVVGFVVFVSAVVGR